MPQPSLPPLTPSPREKFQALLKKLFQFDSADLDFGIYRIMNQKRAVIERFIEKDLLAGVAKELAAGTLAQEAEIAQQLAEVTAQIKENLGDDALDAEGNLAAEYHGSKLGRQYLALRQRAAGTKSNPEHEAEIFNHLYNFFSRYYDEGDFMSLRRYSKRDKYAIPYNGEEVYFYWANADQYYIKTGENFTDYSYRYGGWTVHFKLRSADVDQNNVTSGKRFFLPRVADVVADATGRTVTIPFQYRPLSPQEEISYKSNVQKTILTEAEPQLANAIESHPDALIALLHEKRKDADGNPVSLLHHHLLLYTQKNSSDFFVHKGLKEFLERELDFYLKNEVLNLDELGMGGEVRSGGWFQRLRAVNGIGRKIIAFVAQIENFQKRVFEKKKFAVEVHYCVTLDRVPEELYSEIAKNKAQIAEWKRLFNIHEIETDITQPGFSEPLKMSFLRTHQSLIVDTRFYTAEFNDKLLASGKLLMGANSLDDALDGLLIHSENFQALSLLKERFQEQVNCIYIDPPYNTGDDDFPYKDNYQHSSWMAMMQDRLALGRSCLASTGSIFTSINDLEYDRLIGISDAIFKRQNHISTLIWNTEGHTDNQFHIKENHEYITLYGKDAPIADLGYVIDPNTREQSNLWKGFAENSITKNGPGNPPSEVELPVGFPVESADLDLPANPPSQSFFNEARANGYITPELTDRFNVSYPIRLDAMKGTAKGLKTKCRVFSGWANVNKLREFIANKCQPINSDGGILSFYLSERGVIYYRKKREKARNIFSVLRNMGTTEQMRSELEAMGIAVPPKLYPKPKQLISYLLKIGLGDGNTVLDFFAGSGTTGQAAIELSRERRQRIRYILIEMSPHFTGVLKARLLKSVYSDTWKNGKPVSRKGSSHAFKYMRLESYEDALDNIAFNSVDQQAMLSLDDYALNYMLDFETKESHTLLNVAKLDAPFEYTLHCHGKDEPLLVDLPETFNYLIGLHVESRESLQSNGVRYLIYRGRVKGRGTVIIWRTTRDWKQKDFEADREFVTKHKLTEGAEDILVNTDSFIPGARSLDPVFKRRMFNGE